MLGVIEAAFQRRDSDRDRFQTTVGDRASDSIEKPAYFIVEDLLYGVHPAPPGSIY